MTTHTHMRTLQGRARILAALGVTSLALIVASPANAIYRNYEPDSDDAPVIERTVNSDNKTPPVDENGKKSCEIANIGGGTSYLPHGTTITVIPPSGKSTTVRCNDGSWVAQLPQPGDSGDYHFEAEKAYVDASGGGYYAQP